MADQEENAEKLFSGTEVRWGCGSEFLSSPIIVPSNVASHFYLSPSLGSVEEIPILLLYKATGLLESVRGYLAVLVTRSLAGPLSIWLRSEQIVFLRANKSCFKLYTNLHHHDRISKIWILQSIMNCLTDLTTFLFHSSSLLPLPWAPAKLLDSWEEALQETR